MMADDESGDVLLRLSAFSDSQPSVNLPIYRYVSATETLLETAPQTWEENRSTLVLCHTQKSLLYPGAFKHDLTTRTLTFNGKEVTTVFPTVLGTAVDWQERLVAVLSAEGAFRKGSSFIAGGTAKGNRAHQVFRFQNGFALGEATVLTGTTEQDDITACWAPDGSLVVYRNSTYSQLWFVRSP